jgi:hypothetical protein
MIKKAGCAEGYIPLLHKVVRLDKMYKGSDPDWSSCQNLLKLISIRIHCCRIRRSSRAEG